MNLKEEISITFSKENSEFLIKMRGNQYQNDEENRVVLHGWDLINSEIMDWLWYRNMISDIQGWENVYREAVKQLLQKGWRRECFLEPISGMNELLIKSPYIPCINWREQFSYPALVAVIEKGDKKSKDYNYSELDHYGQSSDVMILKEDIEWLDLHPGDKVNVIFKVEEL